MPWGAIAATYVAAMSAKASENASANATPATPKPDLERVAREHRARMDAMYRETMWGAKVGTWLLLALVVVAIYGAAKLLTGL